MAFVEVCNRWALQTTSFAECVDSADATNTENEFLLDAVLIVATAQAVSNVAELFWVCLDVGIKQQQWDAANVCYPQCNLYFLRTWVGDRNSDLLAVLIFNCPNRQFCWIVVLVLFLLPTVTGH